MPKNDDSCFALKNETKGVNWAWKNIENSIFKQFITQTGLCKFDLNHVIGTISTRLKLDQPERKTKSKNWFGYAFTTFYMFYPKLRNSRQ